MRGSKFAAPLNIAGAANTKTKTGLNETYLSAQRAQTQAYTWISCPHEDERRPPYSRRAPRQRPHPIGCVVLASARYGLPKSHRLLRPVEFTATLKSSLRWRNDYFGLYVVPNPYPHGRLGIVVSRKTSPRAVVRNRVKRQIRESFRRQQGNLAGLDIVVVAGIKAGNAHVDAMRASLQQLWEKVQKRCGKS
jgi:ribonuclease P protein component